MVCYTGTDSKLIMNLGRYVFKMSAFEKILNRIMVLNLLLAIVIAFITTFFTLSFNSEHKDDLYIFEGYKAKGTQFITAFFSIYLIVNSFVPLDLLAMLEISKLMFTPVMENDA